MKRLRRYFLSGIATILPLGLTILILWFLVSRFGSLLSPFISLLPFLSYLPKSVLSFVGFIALLILIIAIGALTSGILGKWLFGFFQDLFSSLPIVKSIYGSAKILTDAVLVDRKSLKKMVIVEYPRKGIFTFGFLMLEEKILLPDGKEYKVIFVPSTPNPTSGWLILVPQEEVREVAIPVDEGLRVIVSGGIVLTEAVKKKLAGNGLPLPNSGSADNG